MEVIDTLDSVEQDVQDRNSRWYTMQIRPYKTMDNKIGGAVVFFTDINVIKQALVLSQEARYYAEAIVETVREPLLVLDKDLRLISTNKAFYETFKVTPAESQNQLIFSLGNGQWNNQELKNLLKEVVNHDTIFMDFKITHDFPHIGHRTMLVNARPVLNIKTKFILMAIEDITGQVPENILNNLSE